MNFIRAAALLLLAGFIAAALAACAQIGTPMPQPTHLTLTQKNEDALRLIFAGDTMLDDLALPFLLKHGWDYTLRGLAPLFGRADLVGLNLEVPVAHSCRRIKTKKYAYFMVPEALEGLTKNGVHVVTLANNHYRDCGAPGKVSTVRSLDERGIGHVGGGVTEQDACRPLVVHLGDTTIGLLGFYGYRGEHAKHGTCLLNETNVAGLILGLRPLVDVLVVNVHWGKNYVVEIDQKQRRFGHLMLDLGADAVVGHGPHIPQATELYGGKALIYSVGNGAFATGNNRARESLLAEFIVRDKQIQRLVVHPIWNQNRNPQVRWKPRPARGMRANNTLRKLVGASAQLGARFKMEKNVAILNLR